MSGKGSKPRPLSVDQKTFDDNWDKIFKKDTWDHYSDLPNAKAYENDFQDITPVKNSISNILDKKNL